jgi:CRP/FNR family cyclic AMP-dependent transcriptional regulator
VTDRGVTDRLDALRQVDLFADLPVAVLARVAQTCDEVRVRRGDVVVEEGAEGDALFVLLAGALTVSVMGPAGERAVLSQLHPGVAFGELSLLDGGPRSATVQADEESLLLRVPREEVLALVDDPVVARALLTSMAGLMRRLTDHAGDFVFLDLTGRVAKTLVAMADAARPGDGEVHVEITQRRLAETVGATRQSVNQVLGTLSSRGLLEVEGRGVRVRDRAALRKRAGLG